MTIKKHTHPRIIPILSLLIAILCLWGCSSDAPEAPGQEPWDGDLRLMIRVSLGEPGSTSSRALPEQDGFELPTLATEKLQSLRVIIVNNNPASRDYNLIVHNRYEYIGNDGVNLKTMGTFPVEFSTHYRVYLIGNEAGIRGIDGIRELLSADLRAGQLYPNDLLEKLIMTSGDAVAPIINNRGVAAGEALPVPVNEVYEFTTMPRPVTVTSESDITEERSFFITRALSKFSFRFFRTADYNPADNHPTIKSIKITGLSPLGYFLPNTTVYDPRKELESTNQYQGRNITEFRMPKYTPGEYVFTLDHPVDPATIGSNGEIFTPQVYFPESKGGLSTDRFQCSISFDGKEYLPVATLNNLSELPRNTHAVVNITIGNDNALSLKVSVLPWTPRYHTVDFTHNVAMAEDGALSFIESSYASLNKTTGRLVLNDFPQATVGYFGISEPKGCRWDAYLITTAGEPDAIRFQTVGSDGKTVTTTHLTGIIDGKTKTEIKVVAASQAGNLTRSSLLQVMVTMADGLAVPVNVLKSTDYGASIENITFVQNPK